MGFHREQGYPALADRGPGPRCHLRFAWRGRRQVLPVFHELPQLSKLFLVATAVLRVGFVPGVVVVRVLPIGDAPSGIHLLDELGCRRAFVVHGNDGLDEITVTDATRVSELRDGIVKTYEMSPEMLLGEMYDEEELAGGEADENAAILKSVLSGETGAKRDIVLLNAAAGIVAGEKVDTIEEGIELARQSIDSGAAMEKLEILIRETN